MFNSLYSSIYYKNIASRYYMIYLWQVWRSFIYVSRFIFLRVRANYGEKFAGRSSRIRRGGIIVVSLTVRSTPRLYPGAAPLEMKWDHQTTEGRVKNISIKPKVVAEGNTWYFGFKLR